jgi:hypothetical protein
MEKAMIILNIKTNTYHVLFNGIIFNRVMSWDYDKLIRDYPKVAEYTVCMGTNNPDLVHDIVRGYIVNYPYDHRFDKL